jgi:hypothetical protein
MSKTDRLYCTHCTFGTSALETHSADTADKVLGYSVRASSVGDADRGRLRQLFRAVERLLSYELPRDTPAGKKESLDAATAPRRLTFLPNLGDCQIVGQISYRSRDTAGRPGSYFADILVGELGRPSAGRAGQRSQSTEGRWSPAECLRLWSADHDGKSQGDWWCDSEERLAAQTAEGRGVPVAPSGGLADVRSGGAECISDAVFWSFLNTAPGGDFDDLGRIIPPRWRNMPVEDRQSLVANLLQATIDLLKNRGRGNVVVAVEPSVAALLFYGVCRLLPESLTVYSDQAAGISFSTYEPFPERPMTNLVATTFFDIDNPTNDLPQEVYQRGFACNTFRQPFKCLKDGRELSRSDSYAQHILRLATDGHALTRDHADEHELLRTLNGLTNLNVSMLDQLVELDRSLAEYIHGVRPWAEVSRTSKAPSAGAEAEFLRKRFGAMLEAGARQRQGEWPPDLLQRAIEWLGDELVAEDGLWGERHPESYRVLAGMLPTTEAALKEFISSRSARQPPDQVVVEAVVSVAHRGHKIPDCVGDFLKERENAGRTKGTPPLFQTIVERLDKNQLPDILLHSSPEIHADRILSAITSEACGLPKPIVAGLLEKLLGKVLDDSVPAAVRWRLLAAHLTAIKLPEWLGRPIEKELQNRLDRLFSGSGPQSGLRNEPPGVTSSDGLQALDFWAGLTTQFPENALLLKSWRDFYKGFNKLKEKIKASQGKGFKWGGASKAIREDVAVVADSLCKIKGLRSCADMEKHHAAQCIGLFRSVLKAKESGVTAEASKQLDDLMQQHLDAHLATRAKSKSRSNAAPNGARKGVSRGAMIAAGVAILIAGAAGTYVAVYGVNFSPSNGSKTANTGKPKSPSVVVDEGSEKATQTAHTEDKTVASAGNSRVQADVRGTGAPSGDSPKLTPQNIKFSLDQITEGKVVMRWNPDIAKQGTCELAGKLRNDEEGTTSDITVTINADKQPHTVALYDYGYGTYTFALTCVPADGTKPIVSPRQEVTFPRPKPPVVESLRLLVDPFNSTPELEGGIGREDQASLYGKPTYTLRASRGLGKPVWEAKATPTAKGEIKFKMPAALSPQDFLASDDLRVTFQATMTPLGAKPEMSSTWSGPIAAKVDAAASVAAFMKRQLDEKTNVELNVKGVCPLKRELQQGDSLIVSLIRLSPLLQDGEIDLVLLTPKWREAEGSRRQLKIVRRDPAPGGSLAWEFVEEAAATSLVDVATFPLPQPLKCGEFYIERQGWQSELKFRQEATDAAILDAIVRLSYCKLGVVSRPQSGDPKLTALLQLLKPIRHAGKAFWLEFDDKAPEKGKSISQFYDIPLLLHAPLPRFQSPPDNKQGSITAAFERDRPLPAIALYVDTESLRRAPLAKSEIEINLATGKLKLKPFEWAIDEKKELFGRFPFPAGNVLNKDLNKEIQQAAYSNALKKGSGIKDMQMSGKWFNLLFPHAVGTSPRRFTPSDLLEQARAELRAPKDGSEEYKQFIEACIGNLDRLNKRQAELVQFIKEVQKVRFHFAPWSIEWPVEFPAGAGVPKSEDNYESVGGLVVKAIVCSDSDKAAEAATAPAQADAPAAAK